MMEKINKLKFEPDPTLKLMDQVRQVLCYHHYAYRTEQGYLPAALSRKYPTVASEFRWQYVLPYLAPLIGWSWQRVARNRMFRYIEKRFESWNF